MSETQFTPGPWEIVGDAIVREVTVNGHRVDFTIADVIPTGVDDYPEQYRANAHLIAAAPELYHSADCSADLGDDICAWFEAGEEAWADKDWTARVHMAAIVMRDKARAALSKANGQ